MNENADNFAEYFHLSLNESVARQNFPLVLKQTDATPVFKKGVLYRQL